MRRGLLLKLKCCCRSIALYTRQKGGSNTEDGDGADTHDEQHRYGVFASYGDEVGRVCVVAGTNDVDECSVIVSDVHNIKFFFFLVFFFRFRG
jgi:hypothetical protein